MANCVKVSCQTGYYCLLCFESFLKWKKKLKKKKNFTYFFFITLIKVKHFSAISFRNLKKLRKIPSHELMNVYFKIFIFVWFFAVQGFYELRKRGFPAIETVIVILYYWQSSSPLCVHTGSLRHVSLRVMRATHNFAFLLWNSIKFPDQRNLLSYVIVYRRA